MINDAELEAIIAKNQLVSEDTVELGDLIIYIPDRTIWRIHDIFIPSRTFCLRHQNKDFDAVTFPKFSNVFNNPNFHVYIAR